MPGGAVGFILGFLLALVLVHFLALIDRMMELRPALNRIEHDLKKYDELIEESRTDAHGSE